MESPIVQPIHKSIKSKAGKKYLGQYAVKGQQWSIRPSSGPG